MGSGILNYTEEYFPGCCGFAPCGQQKKQARSHCGLLLIQLGEDRTPDSSRDGAQNKGIESEASSQR